MTGMTAGTQGGGGGHKNIKKRGGGGATYTNVFGDKCTCQGLLRKHNFLKYIREN